MTKGAFALQEVRRQQKSFYCLSCYPKVYRRRRQAKDGWRGRLKKVKRQNDKNTHNKAKETLYQWTLSISTPNVK